MREMGWMRRGLERRRVSARVVVVIKSIRVRAHWRGVGADVVDASKLPQVLEVSRERPREGLDLGCDLDLARLGAHEPAPLGHQRAAS
jgi:hypothetical protein